MGRFLLVCLGGAVGTGARYLISNWTLKSFGPSFPYGTLAVNLIGSLLLAALLYSGTDAANVTPTMRLALTTGVMGGFTTYSTFSFETLKYLQSGHWGAAITYITLTFFGCLAASFAGWYAAKHLLPS